MSRRQSPPPEQRRRNQYALVDPSRIDSREQAIGEALRNVTQTPLDRYLATGRLGHQRAAERLWRAGDRFRTDWYLSGLSPSGVGSYTDGGGGGGHPAWLIPTTHRAAVHREAYRAAVTAVGHRASEVLISVCCLEHDVTRLGQDLGWAGSGRSAAGFASLLMALDAVANHYGLTEGSK